jgi:Fe2+ transport system protein FeoA
MSDCGPGWRLEKIPKSNEKGAEERLLEMGFSPDGKAV